MDSTAWRIDQIRSDQMKPDQTVQGRGVRGEGGTWTLQRSVLRVLWTLLDLETVDQIPRSRSHGGWRQDHTVKPNWSRLVNFMNEQCDGCRRFSFKMSSF